MTAPEHLPAAVVGGIGFVAAGALLLLQELDLLLLDWTVLLPALLITLGVITLVTGLLAAHRASR